jgi:hypothetical protein
MKISSEHKIRLKAIEDEIETIDNSEAGLNKIDNLLLQAMEIARIYLGDRNENELLNDLVHTRETQFEKTRACNYDKLQFAAAMRSLKQDFQAALIRHAD